MPGTAPSTRWHSRVKSDWRRAAQGWERFEPQLMYSLSAVDPTLIRTLAPEPGHRVLDLGCGSGEPSLAFAQLVAPRGSVLGVDISSTMLSVARRRARLRGIRNVRFAVADASRWRPGRARFDRAVSRYGLMFVEDIAGTLERVRAALRPGGRMAAAVWGPVARNPRFAVRAEAVRPFQKEPPPDLERFPNPLRLSRPGLLAGVMRRAGFRGVTNEGVRSPVTYGNIEEVLDQSLGVPGPLRDVYLTLSSRDQARLRGRLARGGLRFKSGPLIRVPGFAWVVSGRR